MRILPRFTRAFEPENALGKKRTGCFMRQSALFTGSLARYSAPISRLLTILAVLALVLHRAGSALLAAESGPNEHWAFQPIRRPPLPTVSPASVQSPVDLFVLGKDEKGKTPGLGSADRRTLIRRLSFDLRGLPPAPEEVTAFLADERDEAYDRLVERFLASPEYGERWGRHWLDLVGYADSNGYFNADSDRPLAWKYRDYVVRSLNANKPLDRFIAEQIAGDELCGYVAGGDLTREMIDPLIATHFWRNAPDGTGESDGNPLEVKVDKYSVLEGNVQIFGNAFLGLTLQCARCHDHKFEPITQRDYYALEAILRPAFEVDHWLKPNERAVEVGSRAEREAHHRLAESAERDLKTLHESLEGLTAPFRKQLLTENLGRVESTLRQEIQRALDTREKDRTEAMKLVLKTNATVWDLSGEALRARFPSLAAAAKTLEDAIARRAAEKPAPLERIAATCETTNAAPPHHLLIRGNHASEGAEVAPAVPVVFRGVTDSEQPAQGSRSSGRRRALAGWVTARDNPLVARVLVNRIWRFHFGVGLVATPDNLGRSGARPSAPELLDWLACELIESGWDLKHLHRLIVRSSTWRQAFDASADGNSAMPRGQLRRLDAEELRDAMLTVSGELERHVGGPSTPTTTDKQGQVVVAEAQAGALRRSLYLQQRRTMPVSFLQTFDGPAHNPVCVQRVSSTVALQSLAMLNSEFVRLRARAFAQRLLRSASDGRHRNEANLVDYAFEIALARPASQSEMAAALQFLAEQSSCYQDQPNAAVRIWTDFCQMLLASNTFLYVD